MSRTSTTCRLGCPASSLNSSPTSRPLHALAGAAATVCAHGRCAGSDSPAGRLVPRAWFAFMLVPILPLPLDGLFMLMRCGLLPLAFVWAFLPVVANARTWLRRLATSTRTITPRWLSSSPEPITAPVCSPVRCPSLRFQPLEIVRAWFSTSPTTFADPSQGAVCPRFSRRKPLLQWLPVVQAPKPQRVLPRQTRRNLHSKTHESERVVNLTPYHVMIYPEDLSRFFLCMLPLSVFALLAWMLLTCVLIGTSTPNAAKHCSAPRSVPWDVRLASQCPLSWRFPSPKSKMPSACYHAARSFWVGSSHRDFRAYALVLSRPKPTPILSAS
jgi:hypothetical protein